MFSIFKFGAIVFLQFGNQYLVLQPVVKLKSLSLQVTVLVHVMTVVEVCAAREASTGLQTGGPTKVKGS